jgi:hypothetical protein
VEVVSAIDDRPGNIITRTDDRVIAGLAIKEAVSKLQGNPGRSVKLDIQRASLLQPIAKMPTREIQQSAVGSLSPRRWCRWLQSDHRSNPANFLGISGRTSRRSPPRPTF